MNYGSVRNYNLDRGNPARRRPTTPTLALSKNNGDLLVLRAKAIKLLRENFPSGDYHRFLSKTLGGSAPLEIQKLSAGQLEVVIETLEGQWHKI